VAGADLSPGILVVLGVANLAGDGFSMAAGNYLSTQAEQQQRDRLRRMESRHIDMVPDGEREEIRQIFAGYGVTDEALEQAVVAVTGDRERWIDVMLREEHGVSASRARPFVAALVTFVAFLLIGLIPLMPFLANLLHSGLVPAPFAISTACTGAAFFLVGAIKSRFVDEHWLRAGSATLFVGGLAAGIAYVLGAALRGLAT
jgi:VIT1/CCC1 family predicted Fe2+/Mn2+ transporter